MKFVLPITIICFLVSYFVNKEKTMKAIKIGSKKIKKVTIPFLEMIAIVSLVLTLIPESILLKIFSVEHPIRSLISGLLFGSVSAMPGFIAFPMSGFLHGKGIPLFVLSAFTTTLMLVGVSTLSLEIKFIGQKNTFLRNLFAFFTAVIIAVVTGFIFGEFK